MLQAAKKWYSEHQDLSPLEKVNHHPEAPEELKEARYQRLEKRAAALLMASIPTSQQEEVISSKEVSVMNILARLMLSYQPGGLSEKAAILSSLDSPDEAQTLVQAVLGLRKWLRWHRRAGEIGVVRPDSTIQVKGLQKLMRKILKEHQDLGFRIQLAKSSLQIDTAPTESSVMTYANHLLAEVEQIAHQDKRKKEDPKLPPTDPAKVKRMEDTTGSAKGDGKGKDRTGGVPCKFYNSEEGCKKGKQCTWPHVNEGDRRRCYNCGSTQHLAPACERPKEGGKDAGKGSEAKSAGKGNAKAIKKEEATEKEEAQEDGKKEEGGSAESMKDFLEEAHRMLKSMNAARGFDEVEKTKNDRLTAMQQQLDELRKMKVIRLSRIERNDTKYGLLDSGATHALRSARPGEDMEKLEKVSVTLADGHVVSMRMTPSGVMVMPDPNIEPIIPMGCLGGKLGYTLVWQEGKLRITHPQKKEVKVTMRQGCPQVSKKIALQLISELESEEKMKKVKEKSDERRTGVVERIGRCTPGVEEIATRSEGDVSSCPQ